jgi:methylmalonyl-CoA/ethylmalonyl-CoA epimerase
MATKAYKKKGKPKLMHGSGRQSPTGPNMNPARTFSNNAIPTPLKVSSNHRQFHGTDLGFEAQQGDLLGRTHRHPDRRLSKLPGAGQHRVKNTKGSGMSDDQFMKSATETGAKLEGIGQIAIYVSDLARSKEFYGQTLGLTHLFDAGSMSFFQCGDVRLLIGASDKPIATGGVILYFRVADINQACGALSARGIEIVQPPQLVARMPNHDLWLAVLNDPDGHPIELMCEMPHAAT